MRIAPIAATLLVTTALVASGWWFGAQDPAPSQPGKPNAAEVPQGGANEPTVLVQPADPSAPAERASHETSDVLSLTIGARSTSIHFVGKGAALLDVTVDTPRVVQLDVVHETIDDLTYPQPADRLLYQGAGRYTILRAVDAGEDPWDDRSEFKWWGTPGDAHWPSSDFPANFDLEPGRPIRILMADSVGGYYLRVVPDSATDNETIHVALADLPGYGFVAPDADAEGTIFENEVLGLKRSRTWAASWENALPALVWFFSWSVESDPAFAGLSEGRWTWANAAERGEMAWSGPVADLSSASVSLRDEGNNRSWSAGRLEVSLALSWSTASPSQPQYGAGFLILPHGLAQSDVTQTGVHDKRAVGRVNGGPTGG